MATVTLADMESKLLSMEELTNRLQKTEPLATDRIDNESTIRFSFGQDWAHGLEAISGTETVGATMTINGTERALTKEAALQAGANFGLPAPYMRKIPAAFTERLLNYHYGPGMDSSTFNVLSVADNVAAFTRPTLRPFSNLRLLESLIEGINGIHGDVPIFADYKMGNSLLQTDVRLITPAIERHIVGGGMDDVPEGGDDTWLAGIHFRNSLVGKVQTSLETYMFRYWCTNGATTTVPGIGGTWSRRSDGQDEGEMFEWAQGAVDEVLGSFDTLFDQVQALTSLNVNGNTAEVLREIFEQHEVPVSQRESIMRRLLAMENITMYSIMQAITQVANEEDMDDRRRDRLMRIGGALPTKTFDTLKARVWREGHAAEPTSPNPYEPLVRVA